MAFLPCPLGKTEHVILYAGASVIGHSKIGANSMILNRDIPANKIILVGYVCTV